MTTQPESDERTTTLGAPPESWPEESEQRTTDEALDSPAPRRRSRLGVHLFGAMAGLILTPVAIGFLTVGVAVPTPGMVGGFHATYKIALLHFAFASGPAAAASTAAAAALACHALTNLPVLVLGLFFFGREGLSWGGVSRLADEPAADGPESPQPARSA